MRSSTGRPYGTVRVAVVLVIVVFVATSVVAVAVADPGPREDPFASSDVTYPVLNALASHWAQWPVTVECPASQQSWDADPFAADALSYTWSDANWTRVEPDVCTDALHAAGENTLNDAATAAAILIITHESWNLRMWIWRANEARVACQAIRHFKQSVRLLGVRSRSRVDYLYSYAWAWDKREATLYPRYRWRRCKIAKPTPTW